MLDPPHGANAMPGVELVGDAVLVVDPDGVNRSVSPTAMRIFGVPSDIILRDGVARLVHPDDREAEASLRSNLLTGLRVEDSQTFRVLHGARGIVWVEARGRRLVNPTTGAMDGFVAVLRDVTMQRVAEEMRSKAEAQYRVLAENIGDALACLDLELNYTYVSPAFGAMFGCRPDAVLGEPHASMVHADDLAEIQRRLGLLISGASPNERIACRMRHRQGDWRSAEVLYSTVRNAQSGPPTAIVAAIRDVSQRPAPHGTTRAAEITLHGPNSATAHAPAVAVSPVKPHVLIRASHKLRTLSNTIIDQSKTVRGNARLDAGDGARVDAIIATGEKMLDIVSDALDWTDIEAGQTELRAAAVDLRQIVDRSTEMMRPAAFARGLGLDVSVAPGTPSRVVVDRALLHKVLLHLLSNAVKFTVEGGIAVRVLTDADMSVLRFEIIDTGPGIAPAQRVGLFDHAERANDDGGLGLALSARLATLMHGRIGCSDNPSGGSVFWLELPLEIVNDRSRPAQSAMPAPVIASRPARRILVVDDQAMNREVATAILQSAGHAVIVAEDGGEAADLATSEDFDLILMDVRMPRVDGLEATRRIRRLPGQRGRVPIVALTAQSFAEQIRACREAGMDSHLGKPFNQHTLLEAVSQAIEPKWRRVKALTRA